MLTLYWIIAGSLVLTLLVPMVLFACMSFEPHLAQRRRRREALVARQTSPCPTLARVSMFRMTAPARSAVRPEA